MRWVALTLLALSMGASAQTLVSTTDPAGDANVKGAPLDALDLLGASVDVADGNLTVIVTVADAEEARRVSPSSVPDVEYWVEFRYRNEVFHVSIEPDLFVSDSGGPVIDRTWVNLYRETATANPPWALITTGISVVDISANTFTGIIPLSQVAASDDFVPGPGEPLDVVAVAAYFDEGPDSVHTQPREGANVPLGNLASRDDSAFAPGSLVFVPGIGNGALALATQNRIRFSNGEATTYHWPLSIQNRLTTPVEATLSASGPSELALRLPDLVTLKAGEAKVVDIFATVPFVHEHGGSRVISLAVDGGSEHAGMDLEIRYLDVPQPAGHHPQLFFHRKNAGGGQSGAVWMDTVAETERPHDEQMQMEFVQCGDGDTLRSAVGLEFSLSPALLIGVDGRLQETATLTGTLRVSQAMPASTLVAHLMTYNPLGRWENRVPVDETSGHMPLAQVVGGSDIPFALEVPLPPELDLLGPASGLNLLTHVAVCEDGSGQSEFSRTLGAVDQGLYFLDGMAMVLPLNEYHDVIPLSAQNGPLLTVDEAQKRIVPGGDVLWDVRVAGNASRYEAELFGVSSTSATLHTASVGAGGILPVSLRVPDDARPGDVLEVILSVHAEGDEQASSAIRLSAVVDAAGSDESEAVKALGSPARGSPAGSLPAAVLALVFLAVALRRRH